MIFDEPFGGDKAAQKAYDTIYGRPGQRVSDGDGNLLNNFTGDFDPPFTQGANAAAAAPYFDDDD